MSVIILKTPYSQTFTISRKAAMATCKLLHRMLEDQDDDDDPSSSSPPITLEVDCDAQALPLVIEYCNNYTDSTPPKLSQPLQPFQALVHCDKNCYGYPYGSESDFFFFARYGDDTSSYEKIEAAMRKLVFGSSNTFDLQFVEKLVPHRRKFDLLFQVMAAAHYLDNESLLDLCCARVAMELIQHQETPNIIRDMFHLHIEYTTEEREWRNKILEKVGLTKFDHYVDYNTPHKFATPQRIVPFVPLTKIPFLTRILKFACITPKTLFLLTFKVCKLFETTMLTEEYGTFSLIVDNLRFREAIAPVVERVETPSNPNATFGYPRVVSQQNIKKAYVPLITHYKSITDIAGKMREDGQLKKLALDNEYPCCSLDHFFDMVPNNSDAVYSKPKPPPINNILEVPNDNHHLPTVYQFHSYARFFNSTIFTSILDDGEFPELWYIYYLAGYSFSGPLFTSPYLARLKPRLREHFTTNNNNATTTTTKVLDFIDNLNDATSVEGLQTMTFPYHTPVARGTSFFAQLCHQTSATTPGGVTKDRVQDRLKVLRFLTSLINSSPYLAENPDIKNQYLDAISETDVTTGVTALHLAIGAEQSDFIRELISANPRTIVARNHKDESSLIAFVGASGGKQHRKPPPVSPLARYIDVTRLSNYESTASLPREWSPIDLGIVKLVLDEAKKSSMNYSWYEMFDTGVSTGVQERQTIIIELFSQAVFDRDFDFINTIINETIMTNRAPFLLWKDLFSMKSSEGITGLERAVFNGDVEMLKFLSEKFETQGAIKLSEQTSLLYCAVKSENKNVLATLFDIARRQNSPFNINDDDLMDEIGKNRRKMVANAALPLDQQQDKNPNELKASIIMSLPQLNIQSRVKKMTLLHAVVTRMDDLTMSFGNYLSVAHKKNIHIKNKKATAAPPTTKAASPQPATTSNNKNNSNDDDDENLRDLVRYLVEKEGADVTATNYYGETPIEALIGRDGRVQCMKTFEYLYNKGQEHHLVIQQQLIYQAVRLNRLNIVAFLLDRNPKLASQPKVNSRLQELPIHFVDSIEMAKLLITKGQGVNVNAVTAIENESVMHLVGARARDARNFSKQESDRLLELYGFLVSQGGDGDLESNFHRRKPRHNFEEVTCNVDPFTLIHLEEAPCEPPATITRRIIFYGPRVRRLYIKHGDGWIVSDDPAEMALFGDIKAEYGPDVTPPPEVPRKTLWERVGTQELYRI